MMRQKNVSRGQGPLVIQWGKRHILACCCVALMGCNPYDPIDDPYMYTYWNDTEEESIRFDHWSTNILYYFAATPATTRKLPIEKTDSATFRFQDGEMENHGRFVPSEFVWSALAYCGTYIQLYDLEITAASAPTRRYTGGYLCH